MKNSLALFLIILLSVGFYSCGIVRVAPKYSFANGFYSSNKPGEKQAQVFVENSKDSIYVYQVAGDKKTFQVDTAVKNWLSFPQQDATTVLGSVYFKQASFDIDFLTIPFKLRPAAKGMPAQFNTNLNGAVYLGFRNDIYHISYKKTPLGRFQKETTHYGFSAGLFNGLGGTAMNPWVTRNIVAAEYDGVVWSKGLSGIIGINNFTIGLAIGWDHLLDKNKSYWIYEGKPWMGLAFGLNLN